MNQIQREDVLRVITMGVLGSRDYVPVKLHSQFTVLWDFTSYAVAKCLGIELDRVPEILNEVMGTVVEDGVELDDVFGTLIVDILGRAEEPL